MGDYQYLPEATDDTDGVIRTIAGLPTAYVPPDQANADWLDYLIWKAVPNTPDAAASPTLSEERVLQKGEVDGQAELEFAKDNVLAQRQARAGTAFGLLMSYLEAREHRDKAWAQIYCADSAATQGLTADTPAKLTCFTTDGPEFNCTAASSSDKITIDSTGIYLVALSMVADGFSSAATFKVRIRYNAVDQAHLQSRIEMEAGGQAHPLSIFGLLSVSTASQDLDVEVESSIIVSLVVPDAQLTVVKLCPETGSALWPMLNGLVPNEGADIAAVAAALQSEWATADGRTADVEDVRRKAHADIDAAGTLAAIRAVVSGLSWPA